jgi:hypothetical protein
MELLGIARDEITQASFSELEIDGETLGKIIVQFPKLSKLILSSIPSIVKSKTIPEDITNAIILNKSLSFKILVIKGVSLEIKQLKENPLLDEIEEI